MRRTLIAVTVAAVAVVGLGAAPANAASCKLTKDADGTWSPVVCKNGKPNARIKGKLKKATPNIMALQKSAKDEVVVTAICTDIADNKATNPMVYDALEYLDARYNWGQNRLMGWSDALVNGKLCN